jgi:hypothetical protein
MIDTGGLMLDISAVNCMTKSWMPEIGPYVGQSMLRTFSYRNFFRHQTRTSVVGLFNTLLSLRTCFIRPSQSVMSEYCGLEYDYGFKELGANAGAGCRSEFQKSPHVYLGDGPRSL